MRDRHPQPPFRGEKKNEEKDNNLFKAMASLVGAGLVAGAVGRDDRAGGERDRLALLVGDLADPSERLVLPATAAAVAVLLVALAAGRRRVTAAITGTTSSGSSSLVELGAQQQGKRCRV